MSERSEFDKAMRVEARALMVDAVERGKSLAVDDMIDKIIRRHPSISGEDADWYRVCAHGWTRHVLRNCMRGFVEPGPEADTDMQLPLPGADRLLMGYFIEQDAVRKFVPLSLMTATECRAKALEYKGFAAGALLHAQELERYADSIDN